jgi:glycosyltransferase involved in cell wall biosynthesis
LFRGNYNQESGIEILAGATKLLVSEDITFWILCPGLPNHIKFSPYTYINRTYIKSQGEISNFYRSAQITVGQVSKNRRLGRTIPHKAFESAYLSKPYITAGNSGIKEIFVDNLEVICVRADDAQDLAQKIKHLIDNPRTAELFGKNMNLKYLNFYSQEILAKTFLSLITT